VETAWDVLDAQWRNEVTLDWSPSSGPVIVALDSEKGGVGKTGLAGGLLAVAAAAGMRVIAVDLDPRATLTEELDAAGTGQYTVNDLLYVDPSADARELPTLRGLAEQALRPAGPSWPSSVQVLAAERALAHRESDVTANLENRLKVSLQGVAEQVDLVVIDLPPRAGGKLVGSGLLAATHGLVPATLDEDGYIGARDALRTIEITTSSDPTPMRPVGVVRNIVDRRTTLAKTYDDKLREDYGADLLDVVVPKRVLRQEARTACVPITTASGGEARALRNAYTLVLNRIAEVA
jgi:chromosome partitioning protein